MNTHLADIIAFFSWSGTMGRRAYLRHAALATALFAAGLYLQIRYEDAFTVALGLSTAEGEPRSLLFLLPWWVEFASALSCPFTLPAMVVVIAAAVESLSPEAAAAMGASSPALCIGVFILSTLLMLAAGFRNLALASRRLRDAELNLWHLVALFSVLIVLYGLVLDDALPFASLLYLLALVACFILQCCMFFRRTRLQPPDA